MTTRWSLITRAADASGAASGLALAELCALWRPAVWTFLRRKSGQTQADDLTQDFFLHFIENGLSAKADATRGRFRSFLYSGLQRWWIDQQRAAAAQKRGGSQATVDFDQIAVFELNDNPEAAFDRAFAGCMLRESLRRLRHEADRNGRLALFEAARSFLLEQPDAGDYAEAAASLTMQPNTFAVAVGRLRKRLQAIVREMVSDTTNHPQEAAAELRLLRGAWRDP